MKTTIAVSDPIASIPQDAAAETAGAEGIVLGMVAATVLAGVLEIIQARRLESMWPVPLIIYATLLPILTFIIVAAELAGEGVGLWMLAAVMAPLPLVILGRRRRQRKSTS